MGILDAPGLSKRQADPLYSVGIGPSTQRLARTGQASLSPWFDTSLATPRLVYNDGVRHVDASGNVIRSPFAQTLMDDPGVTNYWRMSDAYAYNNSIQPDQIDKKGGIHLVYGGSASTSVLYTQKSLLVGDNDASCYFAGNGKMAVADTTKFNWEYTKAFEVDLVFQHNITSAGAGNWVMVGNYTVGGNGWEIRPYWTGSGLGVKLGFVGGASHTAVTYQSDQTVPTNTPIFLTVGYDPSTFYAYMSINGVEQTPHLMSAINGNSLVSTNGMCVGARPDGTLGWVGYIDEIAIRDSTQNPVLDSAISQIPLAIEYRNYLSSLARGFAQLGQMS